MASTEQEQGGYDDFHEEVILDEDDDNDDQYGGDQGAGDPLQCGDDNDDNDITVGSAIVMDNAELDDEDGYDDDVAEYLETSVDPSEMLAMSMDSSGSQEEQELHQQMPGVPPAKPAKRGRGRGRPRKYPQAPLYQGHTAFRGRGVYGGPPVIKRGRGRPRKDGTIGGPSRRQRNRGGKRGRPRKYEEAPLNITPNDSLDADLMMMQDEASLPDMTSFKRGPGRPRKSDYFVGPGGNLMLVGGTSRRRSNQGGVDGEGNKNKCPFCLVYVVGVQHFRHHLKTAHSRKMRCGQCNFKTPFQLSMDNHRFSKHGIGLGRAPITCPFCPYNVFQWGRMYDHLHDHQEAEEEQAEQEQEQYEEPYVENDEVENDDDDDDDDVIVTGVVKNKPEPEVGTVDSFLGKLQQRKRGFGTGAGGQAPSVRLPGGVTLTWNGGGPKKRKLDEDQDSGGASSSGSANHRPKMKMKKKKPAGSVEIFPLPLPLPPPVVTKPRKVKQLERTICSMCEARFSSAAELKAHMQERYFSGPPPYRCPKCDFATPVKFNLPQHYDICHRKIPDYECAECDFKTHAKPYLRNHEKAVHEGRAKPKNMRCPHCQYRTNTRFCLVDHIRRKHSRPINEDYEQEEMTLDNMQVGGDNVLPVQQHFLWGHQQEDDSNEYLYNNGEGEEEFSPLDYLQQEDQGNNPLEEQDDIGNNAYVVKNEDGSVACKEEPGIEHDVKPVLVEGKVKEETQDSGEALTEDNLDGSSENKNGSKEEEKEETDMLEPKEGEVSEEEHDNDNNGRDLEGEENDDDKGSEEEPKMAQEEASSGHTVQQPDEKPVLTEDKVKEKEPQDSQESESSPADNGENLVEGDPEEEECSQTDKPESAGGTEVKHDNTEDTDDPIMTQVEFEQPDDSNIDDAAVTNSESEERPGLPQEDQSSEPTEETCDSPAGNACNEEVGSREEGIKPEGEAVKEDEEEDDDDEPIMAQVRFEESDDHDSDQKCEEEKVNSSSSASCPHCHHRLESRSQLNEHLRSVHCLKVVDVEEPKGDHSY